MATRKTTKKQTTSTGHSISNEIIAVVLLAVAVLIFLCLVTYSPNDWSLNTESTQQTSNWIGIVGSVIADLLFQSIGLTAYFLPALLGIVAWRSFRSTETSISFSRIIGYFLFIVSLSSLSALFDFRGGITGVFFIQIFSYLIGTIGSGILLSAFLLMAIILITNISFASFFSNFDMAWQNFQIRFEEYFVGYKKWREKRNAAALERMEKRRRVREEEAVEEVPTISIGDEESVEAKESKTKHQRKSFSGLKKF